jgi:hypothetical protein
MGDGLPDIYDVGERFWVSGHNVATTPKICAPYLEPRVSSESPRRSPPWGQVDRTQRMYQITESVVKVQHIYGRSSSVL